MTTAANLSIGLFDDDAIDSGSFCHCGSGQRGLFLASSKTWSSFKPRLFRSPPRTTFEVAECGLAEAALEVCPRRAAVLQQRRVLGNNRVFGLRLLRVRGGCMLQVA